METERRSSGRVPVRQRALVALAHGVTVAEGLAVNLSGNGAFVRFGKEQDVSGGDLNPGQWVDIIFDNRMSAVGYYPVHVQVMRKNNDGIGVEFLDRNNPSVVDVLNRTSP